jgi:hypothetical protein
MRMLLFLAAFSALSAHADLFRWIDPQTGSVKYSSTPPPWYGDAERERTAPPVEIIPYRAPGAPAKPGAAPEKPAPAAAVAALEARWAGLLRFLSTLPPDTDLTRPQSGVKDQLAAYQAVIGELNRLDPAGAERRRGQEAAAFAKSPAR